MATSPPVTIGELSTVPAPGSGVKSDWCQQVTQRIHHRFGTPAARATAFGAPNPLPTKGQPSYLTTGDLTEGPEFWNGVAWRKPWNLPWGDIGYVEVTSAQAAFGPAATDITGATITFVAVAGRKYEILGAATIQASGGGTNVTLWIADGANVQLAGVTQTQVANGYTGIAVMKRVTPAAGSVTYKLRASSGATMTMLQSATQPTVLRVHDVGPVGAPS